MKIKAVNHRFIAASGRLRRRFRPSEWSFWAINDQIVTINHPDADASFILPNLSELAEEIRSEIINNLIDLSTMKVLQKTSI